jgi:hypothetical protein
VRPALPASFATWVNPLSWILTLVIVVKINACGFWSNDNHESNKWYQSNRSRVQNSPGERWWGHCWHVHPTLPMSFTTWVNSLSWILTLAIVAEINACKFWSNDNRESNIIDTQMSNEKTLQQQWMILWN